MTTPTLDQNREQISNHLRFLGYDVTLQDKTIFARHPNKPNMMLKVFTEGALVTAIYGCHDTAKRDRAGYLEFINTANANAGISRYYCDKDAISLSKPGIQAITRGPFSAAFWNFGTPTLGNW